MNILFITPTLPGLAESGGLQVTAERLEGLLRAGADVHALCLDGSRGAPGLDADHVHDAGTRALPRTPRVLLASYAAGLPLSVHRNAAPVLMALADRLSARRWDLVYCDHWLVQPAALRIPARRTVLHLHNAEPELIRRGAHALGAVHRVVARGEAARCAGFLKRAVAAVDELHLLSRDDADALAAWGISHPQTRVFLPRAEIAPDAAGAIAGDALAGRVRAVLFAGSLSWQPNADGLHWFLGRCWPAVTKAVDGLVVAGGGADAGLRGALETAANTVAPGFVPDLDAIYARSRVFVAPLWSGSGVKLKIVNALSRGLPVVTTAIGCEGFPPGFSACIRVADDAVGFAAQIDRLLDDDDAWRQASVAATRYAQTHFRGDAWVRWCHELTEAEVTA
jgi:glycosyltransferase involved in cell wall biosynthesis